MARRAASLPLAVLAGGGIVGVTHENFFERKREGALPALKCGGSSASSVVEGIGLEWARARAGARNGGEE